MKSITSRVLSNLNQKENNPVEIIREVFKAQGIALPHGSLSEINSILSSNDYMWWRECSFDEAKAHAENGLPVIGVNSDHMVLIQSNAEAMTLHEQIKGNEAFRHTLISSDDIALQKNMRYYVSGACGSDCCPEPVFKIIGLPENNTVYVGDSIPIFACFDDIENSVDASWEYDANRTCIWTGIMYHEYVAHLCPVSAGTTTITARYGSHVTTITLMVKNKNVVTFNANGGEVSPSSLLGGGSFSVELPAPTRHNHVCLGWYTAANGGTKVGNPGSLYYPSENVTLYAHWLFLKTVLFTNNACYITSPDMPQVKGVMVHSTGDSSIALKRYCPNDDENMIGENEYHNHWNVYHPGALTNGQYAGPHNYVSDPYDSERCVCGGRQVCAHAFIGKLANGTVAVCQCLPWNKKGWHCGTPGNMSFIGFEVCEPPNKMSGENVQYFNDAYEEAVKLTAYLCGLYNINPLQHDANGGVISHKEGHDLGIATNHDDIDSYLAYYNKTMDEFRADVKALM